MCALADPAAALATAFDAGLHLCVGLDADVRRLPEGLLEAHADAARIVAFNREIIQATRDVACAYKPNAAFYEQLGAEGFRALADTVAAVRELAPGSVVILDAKRGDIGSSNAGYVPTVFDKLAAVCPPSTTGPSCGS